MSPYCDYETQKSVKAEGGNLRPDMVVNIPGGRKIVIDSKVSLKHYLSAVESTDEDERSAHLKAHAAAVKSHIKGLSSKKYHKQFSASPEFVVMYIPGEMFYHAALKEDVSLFEYAANARVVIATPMILMAMLRIVAQGWHDARLTENAIAIREAGALVYDQLRLVAERMAAVGDRIEKAGDAYNHLVTGFDGRLWTRAKRLSEMGCGEEQPKELPEPVDTPIKRITRISGDGSVGGVPQLEQSRGDEKSMSPNDSE